MKKKNKIENFAIFQRQKIIIKRGFMQVSNSELYLAFIIIYAEKGSFNLNVSGS